MELLGAEIVDTDVKFYDTLVTGERGYCPVGKSGYSKCKIHDRKPAFDENSWHNGLYGDTVASCDGEYLILTFCIQPALKTAKIVEKRRFFAAFIFNLLDK